MEKYTIEKRACKFCKDMFKVFHASRLFCPEKYGKKDFCSNRFKSQVLKGKKFNRFLEFLKDPQNGVTDSNFMENYHRAVVKNSIIILELLLDYLRFIERYHFEKPFLIEAKSIYEKGFNFKLYKDKFIDENGFWIFNFSPFNLYLVDEENICLEIA